MSSIPTWVTPAGSLGTIPEGVYYSVPLLAEATDLVRYRVIAGRLPPGIQIDETGILSGNPNSTAFVEGVPMDVPIDTTSKFAVRAYTEQVINGVTVISGLADRTFSLTISGQNAVQWVTPTGTIGTYVDGVQVYDLAVEYEDTDPDSVAVVSVIAGSLPPGMTISPQGVISGYITPNTALSPPAGYDLTAYDQYAFDFPQQSTDTTYFFTLKVDNGISSDVRDFNIVVYARNLLTADNTTVTADNSFLTADLAPTPPPIIITPTGSIGTVSSDNFFAFQFKALDFLNNNFEFFATTDLPPGLTLDPNSGWLYGYIPYGGIFSAEYQFGIYVELTDYAGVISDTYNYSLTIVGPIDTSITWLTNSDLGTIDNGATSTFYVLATNTAGIPLQYRLLSGSDSRLPQGLELLPSGNIAGRVSFDTFAVDGGTTTFDVNLNTVPQPTTFDMVARFTVNAYSVNGLISVNKEFSITVVRRYDEPYDNLYIQAMPPQNDRDLLNSLLLNPTIFPPDLIYRKDDPNFGVARNVIYNHAYGLAPATLDEYVASLNLNHYWKNLVLGQIKTARALDDSGNILYEVVYSEIVDNLVNNDGISVGKEVALPYPIAPNTPETVFSVYPNSLENMRDQVIDTVGQVSNVLPRWMLSRQPDGRVLGFTPAWVIAYAKPGQSGQIAYNIQTTFGSQLNVIDFKVDRYELGNYLTKNWDREEQHWIPRPPTLTTFDVNVEFSEWINNSLAQVQWTNNEFSSAIYWTTATPPGTVFDGNSLEFTDPVDMYSPTNTTDFDKYLVFPKRNILE